MEGAHRILLVSLVCIVGALGPASARGASVTEWDVPTPNSQPAGITVGADGALWFTEENASKIGRITTAGTITEYPIPTNPSAPAEITAGPDGALWFTEFGANPPKIGRMTTAGVVTNEWELPVGASPDGITAGPDGAIWFTQNGLNKIGRITMAGTITEYDLVSGYRPGDITPGPDGRLWFTESEAHRIGAITTGAQPEVQEYELPLGTDPSGITASAGSIWFTMHGLDRIGRMPTFGLPFTEFGPTGRGPSGIVFGPDNALWFAETEAGKIGRMTTSGRVTEFALPLSPLGPTAPGEIVAGPDGAMWFTEQGANRIGRIEAGATTSDFVPPPPPPPVPAPTTTKPKTSAKKACRVPKVRGLTVRQARKKMKRAGCRYRVRGSGRVVAVKPRAGQRTRSTVQLRAKRRAR